MLRPLRRRTCPVLVVLVCAFASADAAAQAPRPPVSMTQDIPEADFYFGRPRGMVGLRGTLVVPSEGSDLWDFVQDQLTIDSGDFRMPAFSVDLAFALSPRLEVVAGGEFGRKSVDSEYRDFVDNNLQPIEQTSRLLQNGLTGSLRVALTPRGRSVGRFAWIPARVQPYAGAGGGVVFWKFEQYGDFVDFQDFDIFKDSFASDGASPSVHVLGGADILLYKRLLLSVEGRYQWAKGELDPDFVGFEPLDLSGFRMSVGFGIVF